VLHHALAHKAGVHTFKKRGVIQPLKDFYQQRLALAWRDEQVEIGRVEVAARGDYLLAEITGKEADKIAGESRRFLTIDRQRDHFWAVVRAWKSDGGSRLLWRGRVLTTEQLLDVQKRFGVESQLCFEDAQFSTAQVYEDCIRYGWTALHGSGEDGFPVVLKNGRKIMRFYSPIKQTQVPGGYARYMFWASDPVKDTLAALTSGSGVADWEAAADAGDLRGGGPRPRSHRGRHRRARGGDGCGRRASQPRGASPARRGARAQAGGPQGRDRA
jgi:hypothetical protein